MTPTKGLPVCAIQDSPGKQRGATHVGATSMIVDVEGQKVVECVAPEKVPRPMTFQ